MRQRFQVQHLCALRAKRLQQTRLARAGRAADDTVAVACCQLRQVGHQRGPKGLVAAIDQRDLEADLLEHQGQRAAALAAAPAVQQRLPFPGLVQHVPLDVFSDVLGHQRRAEFFGLELADLLVPGADDFSLLVVQAGPVQRAGQVVLGVFAFAARVDDVGKITQLAEGFFGGNAVQAHLRSFFSSVHTLASILACDCSLG